MFDIVIGIQHFCLSKAHALLHVSMVVFVSMFSFVSCFVRSIDHLHFVSTDVMLHVANFTEDCVPLVHLPGGVGRLWHLEYAQVALSRRSRLGGPPPPLPVQTPAHSSLSDVTRISSLQVTSL